MLTNHRLHREIIATQLTNRIVNRGGIAFDIVRAFMVVCELFDLSSLWNSVEALDNKINATLQMRMMREIRQHIERACRWLLRHHRMQLYIQITINALQS